MKRIIIILALLSVTVAANAQLINPMGEKIYESRVALVDEFIKRFNHDNPSPHAPELDADEAKVADIVQLFNGANFSSADDPLMQIAVDFARDAVASGVRLDYADSIWYARATCHGSYRKKAVEFNLIMRVEPRSAGSDMYRWALCGVEGELFDLVPEETGSGFVVLPDDHETNFMSLTDMTASQTESIRLYASDNAKVDPFTAFMAMVYGGQLKIDYVKPLEFSFTQIPGWEFTIRFFEREELNSGWLIDSIIRK